MHKHYRTQARTFTQDGCVVRVRTSRLRPIHAAAGTGTARKATSESVVTKRRRALSGDLTYYEFNIPRWLTSDARATLDLAGRGIYRDLLDLCYQKGSIPTDLDVLARHCMCSKEELERHWPMIRPHFQVSKHGRDRLTNKYANIFRREFFRYIDTQKRNGLRGGRHVGERIGKNRDQIGTQKGNIDNDIETDGVDSAQAKLKPTQHNTTQHNTTQHNTTHNLAPSLSAPSVNFLDFWVTYTDLTRVPVNTKDRIAAEQEWMLLSFEDHLGAFSFVPSMIDGRPSNRYWLPQNYLANRVWTRKSVGRMKPEPRGLKAGEIE